KSGVPLHVFGGALANAGLDEVEVQNKIERSDCDSEEAKSDSHPPTFMNERDVATECPKPHRHQIDNCNSAGRRRDSQLEVFRRINPFETICYQQHSKGPEGQ